MLYFVLVLRNGNPLISVGLKLKYLSEPLEDLLKHRLLGSFSEFLTQQIWNKGKEFAFLTNYQMIMIQRPHFENHCLK